MGPAQAIKTCLAKSLQFRDRASRPEFWWFVRSFVLASTALSASVPSQIQALSRPQLEELTVLCADQYTGFADANFAFESAGWQRLPLIESEGFTVNLAALQALQLVLLQYLVKVHGEAFSSDSALTGDLAEQQILQVVFGNPTRIKAAAMTLWAEPSAIYISPTQPLVGVRVTFSKKGVEGWRQYCDAVSVDAAMAAPSFTAVFPDQEGPTWDQSVLLTETRYVLTPISPSPSAAVPIANVLLFNKPDDERASQITTSAEVWLRIRIGVREPVDLTPVEANQ